MTKLNITGFPQIIESNISSLFTDQIPESPDPKHRYLSSFVGNLRMRMISEKTKQFQPNVLYACSVDNCIIRSSNS